MLFELRVVLWLFGFGSIICASVKMGKAKSVTFSEVFVSFGAFLCKNSEKFGVF